MCDDPVYARLGVNHGVNHVVPCTPHDVGAHSYIEYYGCQDQDPATVLAAIEAAWDRFMQRHGYKLIQASLQASDQRKARRPLTSKS